MTYSFSGEQLSQQSGAATQRFNGARGGPHLKWSNCGSIGPPASTASSARDFCMECHHLGTPEMWETPKIRLLE